MEEVLRRLGRLDTTALGSRSELVPTAPAMPRAPGVSVTSNFTAAPPNPTETRETVEMLSPAWTLNF